MFVASWNGAEIARGRQVIEVEGRLYYAADDVRQDLLRAAEDRSICEWKGGEAEYFDVVAGGASNPAAAWRYPSLGPNARAIEGRFAFWRGVVTAWQGPDAAPPILTIQPRTPNVALALGAADVIWQPALPGAIIAPEEDPFQGYLIPSLQTLVHVVATPAPAHIPARIAEARALAARVAAWNRAAAGQRFAFVAVWGSAPPCAEAVALLRGGGVILALSDRLEVIMG